MPAKTSLRSPAHLRQRIHSLDAQRQQLTRALSDAQSQLDALEATLDIADEVSETLDRFTRELFGDLTQVLETQLTTALHEVLGQNLTFKAQCRYLRNAAAIEFHIERNGHAEDILQGQGGSVANVLSVGLRIFALTTLDETTHRRVLVLDEQDCWLHPSLVPRLANLISSAAKSLGFQILMISHHDPDLFAPYADKLYRFTPSFTGVKVQELP